MKHQPIKIGCYSAFWGDSIQASSQLISAPEKIDYIVADYLAEVTMGILAKSKTKFISDFIKIIQPQIETIKEKNLKIVTNAGGLDPVGLKEALENALGNEIKVAAVLGDNIVQSGFTLKPFKQTRETKEEKLGKNYVSLNAYLGAFPIAEALKHAQIVITGRVVDSALVLGPLIHEFGWEEGDFDLLAAGSVAGHVIECGCQCTGGNFTDYKLVCDGWDNMGYPIVEVYENGEFIVCKPENTGGLVSVATVGEQLVYEIADPSNYILPDVICDFTHVKLEQVGKDRVKVSGVKGKQPTEFLKVSGVYLDGYKVTGELFIGGLEAKQKAIKVGEAIIKRSNRLINQFGMDGKKLKYNIEVLGSEWTYGHNAKIDSREVVLRLTAKHENRKALGFFLLEIAPSATCMAPGIIGVTSGRPKIQGNMVHVSSLLEKHKVIPKVVYNGNNEIEMKFKNFGINSTKTVKNRLNEKFKSKAEALTKAKMIKGKLIDIAYGRSGDKGDSANIGIIARKQEYYPWIRHLLSEKSIKDYMKHLIESDGEVKRYDLQGIGAVNFVVTNCLGGGGLSSLRVDRQGKSYAQMVLSMDINIPAEFLNKSKL